MYDMNQVYSNGLCELIRLGGRIGCWSMSKTSEYCKSWFIGQIICISSLAEEVVSK